MLSIKLIQVFLLLIVAWCLDGSPGEPNPNNDLVSFGLIEPAGTTKLEMKPLYQGLLKDESKVNRLVKKNRKIGGSHRDSYRLVKAESNDGSEGSDDSSGLEGLIKIDKGLLESHKQQELDHVDHGAKLDEDKFVKIVWDKGDGFVKKWHWDRGEKVKEDHTVAAKKLLDHHEKAIGDELMKKQHGTVVQAVNNQQETQQNRVESFLKDDRNSGSSQNDNSFVQKLRLLRAKPGKGSPKAFLIPIRPGKQLPGDDGEDEDNDETKSQEFHEIGRMTEEESDDDSEDGTRAGLRRFPNKKRRILKANRIVRGKSDDGKDDDEEDDDANSKAKTKVKNHRDYHRRVIVQEEKSQLSSHKRLNGKPNAGEKAYETSSKGSGYIKLFTLTSDDQNNSIDPFDFTALIGDQSKQIETQASESNDGNSKDKRRQHKKKEELGNQLIAPRNRNQPHTKQAKKDHGPSTLHIIDPR